MPLPELNAEPSTTPSLSVRLRVMCGEKVAFGPGKSELLDAIARTGSISKAAHLLGISYMHAWSLVQTMNACFREPLVRAARGGQKGGGTGLTQEGKAVLELYRLTATTAAQAAVTGWEQLRAKLKNPGQNALPQYSVALSTAGDDDDLMEQSIRNEIPGTIKSIVSDKVLSEVLIETAVGEMASIITTRSVEEMGLKVGDKIAALVKATNVSVRRQG